MAEKEVNSDVEDVSLAWQIYVTTSVVLFALVSSTILRIVGRLKHRGSLTLDDYFILLGASINVCGDACDFTAASSGFGRHAQFLSEDELVRAEKFAQLAVPLAWIGLWAIKISICLFLLSIIRNTHKVFTWCVRGLMGLTTITTFVSLLLWGLQARPIQKLWDPRVEGTRTSPEQFLQMMYVLYALNIFTHFLYAISPIYFLWNVKIPTRKKLTIWALTGSGLILTIIAGLVILYAKDFLRVDDITWALVNVFITDIIQRNLSGFVANLPAIYMLYSHIRGGSRSTSQRNTNNQYYNDSIGSKHFRSARNTDPMNITLHTDIYVESNKKKDPAERGPYGHLDSDEDTIPLGMLTQDSNEPHYDAKVTV